ncbi:ISWI chromatin-remodeling complex ATPase ISW2 [Seminavis robusta]|uniref:ISWI chromatin-remodeling complex ATPase ISW2 n=1 Tax=Seminavis robusta TaxID=568900 RepID=A0A9N8HR60_9STRA|nr:ISWI chromatin-remodeling complex ATPase ISW2 [Seminavis robusta]|eukprot:Sro1230_g254570.1 ISWI chromatin-remodeling complex ATPase ISW2 (493) ;mRNA; r:26075-27798
MVQFIRPGIVGVKSDHEFEKRFRKPIERGLPCDASNHDKLVSLEKQVMLKKKLEPYVDRKDASVLRKQLPPIYDNLFYLQQSCIQSRLIKLYEKQQNSGGTKNFFTMYASIAPALNYPGCLKLIKGCRGKALTWKESMDKGDPSWLGGLKPSEFKGMHEARNSPKLIMLAHIVALAVRDGHKTLVYSHDLKTLDIIEWFLQQPDWSKHAHSLKNLFSELKLGGWKKDQDYLRMDGSTNSGKRGYLVDKFNTDVQVKVFVISSRAGGIGINLCSASVVVMLDNHFNPSIADQCISRAHRLGQEKPVHCFRLAIEGTMETKIYARSINKSGVAMQVIDGKFTEKSFTADELSDLQQSTVKAICSRCLKTRFLPRLQIPPAEDEDWYCEMNSDKNHNLCETPEEKEERKNSQAQSRATEDPLLQHLLHVINFHTRRTELVVNHIPVEMVHETDICCEDAISDLKRNLAGGHAKGQDTEPGSNKRARVDVPKHKTR